MSSKLLQEWFAQPLPAGDSIERVPPRKRLSTLSPFLSGWEVPSCQTDSYSLSKYSGNVRLRRVACNQSSVNIGDAELNAYLPWSKNTLAVSLPTTYSSFFIRHRGPVTASMHTEAAETCTSPETQSTGDRRQPTCSDKPEIQVWRASRSFWHVAATAAWSESLANVDELTEQTGSKDAKPGP